MHQSPEQNKRTSQHEPTIAPSMEMDELDTPATDEEVERKDSTSVTKLFIDRVE